MKVGIVDYGVGNLGSIVNALKKLGVRSVVSSNIAMLSRTNALILPGDGAGAYGMKNLNKLGLDKFLKKEIILGKYFLGICLGMQLLMDFSEEGNVDCLGVIPGKVKKLKTKLKIPQIGWNKVGINDKNEGLFKDIQDNSYFYFINSYICDTSDKSIITGITEYEKDFCSSFQKDNVFGVQFHPEKSGEVGLQMLRNFVNLL